MEERTQPAFEDVVRLDDAQVQTALAPAADLIIAAALDQAPASVRNKVLCNLSSRRREAVAAIRTRFGQRTRDVSQRVMVALLWGINDPEALRELGLAIEEPPKESKPTSNPMTKEDFTRLMKYLAEHSPVVKKAQEERRAAIEAGILRAVFGLGASRDD